MSAHPTKEELETAFRGLDYPAPRAKLLTFAYQNNAASSVVDRILDRLKPQFIEEISRELKSKKKK